MRRSFVIASALSFLASPWPVEAANKMREWLDKAGAVATLPQVTAFEVIGPLIKALVGLAGIVYLVLIIHAGFTWMTAQGNTEQLDKAKGSLVHSTIGLILILGAYAIVSFIVGNLVTILTGTR